MAILSNYPRFRYCGAVAKEISTAANVEHCWETEKTGENRFDLAVGDKGRRMQKIGPMWYRWNRGMYMLGQRLLPGLAGYR